MKRWIWFVGLWAGGVLSLGIVAGAIRLLLRL